MNGRNRLAWGLLAPALLLAVAIPAALARRDSRTEKVVTASGRTTVATAPATSTTTLTSTSTQPPATTSLPSTTSARVTTLPPATTTSTLPATTVPATVTTAVRPSCDPSTFTVAQPTTSKPSYKPGEQVVIRATVAYNVPATCLGGSYNRVLTVRNGSGVEVYKVAYHLDYITAPVFQPGAVEVIQFEWNQASFVANGPAPPGTYACTVAIDKATSPAGSVQLVPS